MKKFMNEIKRDMKFIQSHTLQPEWFKILKVFIILGFLLVYFYLFGIHTTLIFFGIFIFLSFVVHMVYRVKTEKWTKSWLDFIVIIENNEKKANSIGFFYYLAVASNAIIAIIISQICG